MDEILVGLFAFGHIFAIYGSKVLMTLPILEVESYHHLNAHISFDVKYKEIKKKFRTLNLND